MHLGSRVLLVNQIYTSHNGIIVGLFMKSVTRLPFAAGLLAALLSWDLLSQSQSLVSLHAVEVC